MSQLGCYLLPFDASVLMVEEYQILRGGNLRKKRHLDQ
jgi:hypothetical protein